MVDKNLFLYDLAVVAIMKNEAPYVKEWLDYHLLAGVDHFYIYDNESPDNLKEVLQPYVDAGIVTYTFYPGKCRQLESYIDAVKRFRFFCRYMAWIDGDEFIFPKNKPTITETVDEILINTPPYVAGLAVNIHAYGSNGQDKADFGQGVLERFTRRAENDWAPPLQGTSVHGGNAHVSTIANPRKIQFFPTPHAPIYFISCFAVNENLNPVATFENYPITSEKIVMNHYSVKSKEEYIKKISRGNADHFENHYTMDKFNEDDRNDVFDDGILKYRDARKAALIQAGGGMESLISSKQVNYPRLFNALSQNLFPALSNQMPREFYNGKVENFLTCLNLTSYLKGKVLDDNSADIFEEMSLIALYKSLFAEIMIADVELLLKEMPKILVMPYDVVEKICALLIEILPQIMLMFRMQNAWQQFTEYEHELEMLKSFSRVIKE